MSLSAAIGVITGFNECATLWQWAKSAISSLHSRWSGSQEQDLQGRVLELESGLQRLRDTLPAMHDLINKAEWRSHDGTVANLLPNLKDAIFDAEDLLLEFVWYEKNVQVEGNASQSPFTEFFDTVIQGNFNKLSDVQSRLTHLSSQLENMGLRGVTQRFDKLVRPETTSLPNESKIFGRDKELTQVLEFLNVPTRPKHKRANNSVNASTSASASNQISNESRISILPILPIVGIGGVGKSTLVQHICSHQRVKSHFEKIIWICVSDDFDVKRLTKEVIQSFTREETTADNLNTLQETLSNHVNNRRLLIVLDDMWDDALKENGQCWKRFCAPFRSVQEGSVMLVTTRCPNVTKEVCTREPVMLEGLKDDVFWKFFKLCAFGSEDSHNDPELECIGRSILPKLKGSPLAAKTLGRMLSRDLQASHWNSILESELWELKQKETEILPALRLSYMYLPFYLKQCFSFCAVYPKDYKFEKERLAEIWAAEGFVDPQGGVPIQDIGCQYFEDLVTRSFFQKVNSRYVIHDLLHDMAQMVSKHDCFILRSESDFDKVPQNVRHLYILPSSDFDDSDLLGLCKYPKLRTLICMKTFGKETGFVMDQWCAKLLRMRVISFAYTLQLPDSIGNWKHLRYLEISRACPLMKTVPSTFCLLYNLQILYAKKCRLESLPSDFGKLMSLQKFESHGLHYYAGSRTTVNFEDYPGHGIWLIKNLNQFRGHLEITNARQLSKDRAAEAELKNKKYLDELTLCLTGIFEEVLEVLQPPVSLKSLLLKKYAGPFLPSWFQPQSLPNLKSLTFKDCGFKSFSMVPQSRWLYPYPPQAGVPAVLTDNNNGSIEIFLSLTDLTIDGCQNLSSHIRTQRLVLPSLSKLSLHNSGLFCNITCRSLTSFHLECESVTSIQLQEWNLPALRKLHIKCKSLTSIRGTGSITAFSSLNVLTLLDCDKLPTLDDLLAQEYLPAIEEIEIRSCRELLSLPGERLVTFPYLKHLVVFGCPSLKWQSGLVLPSCLQRLTLHECGDFSPYVPSCLQSLTSLVSLGIGGCKAITSIPGDIWRSNAASLEELRISDCPDLVSIGGAKAVAKIKEVRIHNCAKLKEAKQINRRPRRR